MADGWGTREWAEAFYNRLTGGGTTTEEAPLWELSPEEMEERFYDLSIEPYSAPSGHHWEQSSYDENLMPAQPHWILVADTVIPEEGGIGYDELSPWEKAQIEQWNKELELDRLKMQQQPMETYDQYKQRLLYELTQPRDWINKWLVINMPTQPETSGYLPVDEMMNRISEATGKDAYQTYSEQALAATDMYKKGASSEEVRSVYPEVAGGAGFIPPSESKRFEGETPTWERQPIERLDFAPWEGAAQAYGGQGGWTAPFPEIPQQEGYDPVTGDYSYIMGPEQWAKKVQTDLELAGKLEPVLSSHQKKKAKTPPAPGWLPQFVPGLVEGQPIEKLPIKTPSGQSWRMQPYSVREGLAGYADYAQDRPFVDIMEHMAMMAPKTPYGAGAERWRPAQQWA